jgi:hypothetical protein
MGEPAGGRLERALAAIDEIHATDPVSVDVAGEQRPHELVHAELVTTWIARLDPGAGETQILAGRASHLRRWQSPRDSYPEGRAGYLRWRSDAAERHATDVAAILEAAGYDEREIESVQRLMRKQGRGRDPAAQVHEDALCLAFLSLDVGDFAAKHGPMRSEAVLAKTVRKMSPRALALAAEVPASDGVQELLAKVLHSEGVAADGGVI